MAKLKIVLFLFAVFLLVLPSFLFPQKRDLKFQHFTSADGLPSDWIQVILQDQFGFLWFGMNNGLVRYDGYQFKIYQHKEDDPNSISGNQITSMHEDKRGDFWITTEKKGLNKFDRRADKFIHFKHDPYDSISLSSNKIRASYLDRSGFLWIVFTDSLVDKADTKTGKITRYRYDPNDSLSIGGNVIGQPVLGKMTCPAIVEDSRGDVWFGFHNSGLSRYNHNTDTFTHYRHDASDPFSLSNDDVKYIFEDSKKMLWVCTWGGGLNRYSRESEAFVHYRHNKNDPNSPGTDKCSFIFEDSSNNLWIATEDGVDYFERDSENFTRYKHNPQDPYSLSLSDRYMPIYEEESGFIWILADWFPQNFPKLNIFNPQTGKFDHYQEDANNPDGIRISFFSSLLKDFSGTLWLGTKDRGLNKLDHLSQNFINFKHKPEDVNSLCGNTVYAILQSKLNPDLVWIGTTAGLSKYNRQKNIFAHFKNDPGNSNSLAHNLVYSLCEDQDGVQWVGTLGGLSRYQNGRFTNYKHNPNDSTSLSGNAIWTLHFDHNGVLWIGTIERGLNCYNRELNKFTRFQHDPANPKSISQGMVVTVYEDKQRAIWIGTMSGLDKFITQDQSFEHYLVSVRKVTW